jgi:hypothetical protein
VAGHGAKLDRRQEQAIAALLTEATVEDAARKARVAYSTLKGWLQLPEFQAAFRAARAALLERTVAMLLRSCAKAVARLDRNLEAESVQGSNRAAELILTQAVKGLAELDLRSEVEDLRRQIAELRELKHGNGSNPPGVAAPADGVAGGEVGGAPGEPGAPGGDRPVP